MTTPQTVAAKYAHTLSPADQAIYQKALSDLPQMALASVGIGAGARGLSGLANLVGRRLNPPTARYPQALVTGVPYPVADDDRDKTAISKADIPWYYPGMGAIGLTGIYGGWKGMDAILNRRRLAGKDDEVDAAKQDFEQSLLENSRTRVAPKLAAEKTAGERLSEALDAVYDTIKQGLWGEVAGLAGLYGVATGLPAALVGYQKGQRSSQRSVLNEAMAQRLRRNYMSRPSEVYAVPTPVHVPSPIADDSSDDTQSDITAVEQETPVEAAEPEIQRRRRVDSLIP